MLWLKGWLETRFRLLYMLIFTVPLLFCGMHSTGAHATASERERPCRRACVQRDSVLRCVCLCIPCRRRHHNPDVLSGFQRPPRIDSIHSLHACAPASAYWPCALASAG